MRRMRKGVWLGLALLSLRMPGVALAAEPSSATVTDMPDYPWLKGVSQEQQDAALVLFREGNTLLKQSVFIQAVEKYRQALQHWDHPAFHYNLAMALMNFDQPLELYEHLEKAMRYGPEGIEKERYEYASAYKALVEKQLVRVTITCDEPGTQVLLDDRLLFVAPGKHEGLTRTGTHTLVARKDGYHTYHKSHIWTSEKPVVRDLKMYSTEDLISYQQRWPAWKPWAVVGSGLAVAAGGGLLHLETAKRYQAYDKGVQACATGRGNGCEPSAELLATRMRGDNLQKAAVGAYALGGAGLLTGAVLLYLNQPKAIRIDPYQSEATVSVTPLLGGDTNGAQVTLRF